MRKKSFIVLSALLIFFGVVAITAKASSSTPATISTTPNSQPVVVRITYVDRARLTTLLAEIDVWAVHPERGYLEARVYPAEYFTLLAQGYRVEVDHALTTEINQPRTALPGQTTGIPGYTCYSTV